ncbi:SAM hydrolase/SAM-dependent halogenase family protein [Desulfocurvus sp. DL9XJH121]
MRTVIALLSDFGTANPYTAQMKGMLISLCPDVMLVDITHEIPPFGLPQGALFLEASRAHFPRETIFVAVVDPGVGTKRRIVALVKDGRTFLAPDNGILGLVASTPGPSRAFDLTGRLAGPKVSHTFHGRDIFAPLAAAMASGESPAALGTEIPVESLTMLPWTEPEWDLRHKSVHAALLHVDRFGNCLTNMPASALDDFLSHWDDLALATPLGTDLPVTQVKTYADLSGQTLGLLAGSQGYMELCMNKANAAAEIGLGPGDAFTLKAKN